MSLCLPSLSVLTPSLTQMHTHKHICLYPVFLKLCLPHNHTHSLPTLYLSPTLPLFQLCFSPSIFLLFLNFNLCLCPSVSFHRSFSLVCKCPSVSVLSISLFLSPLILFPLCLLTLTSLYITLSFPYCLSVF